MLGDGQGGPGLRTGEALTESWRRGAGLAREGRGGPGVEPNALALRSNLRQVRPAGRDHREELARAQRIYVRH